MEMDFMLTAGQSLNRMRLLLEGATVFFENELSGRYRAALEEDDTDEALALDMLGTTLNELRQEVPRSRRRVSNQTNALADTFQEPKNNGVSRL